MIEPFSAFVLIGQRNPPTLCRQYTDAVFPSWDEYKARPRNGKRKSWYGGVKHAANAVVEFVSWSRSSDVDEDTQTVPVEDGSPRNSKQRKSKTGLVELPEAPTTRIIEHFRPDDPDLQSSLVCLWQYRGGAKTYGYAFFIFSMDTLPYFRVA